MESDVKIESVKSLGIFGSLSVFVGAVIGSGIFMNVAETLEVAPQSIGLVILFWVIGGIFSAMGGLCYAELGCTFTEAGGERTYLSKVYGKAYGVTFSYVYTFLIKSTTCAGIAIGCGTYLTEMFLPNCREVKSIQALFATIVLMIVMTLNCMSKKITAQTSIFFTFSKLLALLIIIFSGIVTIATGTAQNLEEPFNYEYYDWSKLGNTFVNIFWTTEGWNILGALVGDMINPKRHLPIVTSLGMFIIVIHYCLAIIAYVVVIGYNNVMTSRAVAIEFALKIFGKWGKIIPIFIACSTFGALNSNIYSVPKVLMMSGFEREVPTIFGLVRREQRTPVVAIVSLVVVSLIFIPFDFSIIVQYCGFISWFFYFMVFSIIIYIRFRRKDLQSNFKVFILIPFMMQLVAIFVMYTVVVVERQYTGCIVMFFFTVCIFFIHRVPEKYRDFPRLKVYHDKLELLLIKLFDLTPTEQMDI